MKKIGVVANHKTINFGTMLQSTATQKALETLGCQAETIDIDRISRDIQQRKTRHFLTQMSPLALLQSKGPFIRKKLHRMIDHSFAALLCSRDQSFQAYREAMFPMSEPVPDRSALTDFSRKYDTVLVGSDQIWLPSNIAADVFTLNFVPDGINKVAYASSFGVSQLPARMEAEARAFLNRIDHVSVRELSGQTLVRTLTGRDVPVVCDPTMLFTAKGWRDIIPDQCPIDEPYIFCYFLGNNPEQRQWVQRAKEATGLKILAPLHMDEYIRGDDLFPDQALYDIGPAEFLNYIRYASYLFTDSFHGTILSILNGVSVFTFNRFKAGAALSTNTRIDSLFAITGLNGRHIDVDADVNACLSMPTDYAQAHQKIAELRERSWQYLKNALGVDQVDPDR